MSGILVMKFGGTSMGSAERIRNAAKICAEERAKRPVVVVVSAMGDTTDELLDLAPLRGELFPHARVLVAHRAELRRDLGQ